MAWTSSSITAWIVATSSIIWCIDQFVPGAEFIVEDISNQISRNLIAPIYNTVMGMLFETVSGIIKMVFFGIFWVLVGFCNAIASIFDGLLSAIPSAFWNIINCSKFVFLWTINFSIFTVPPWVWHVWKRYSVVSPHAIVALFQNSATVQFWDTEERPLHGSMMNILLCLGILFFNILQVYMVACFIWNLIIYYNTFNHCYSPGPKLTPQPRFLPGYNGFNKPMSFPASTGIPGNRMYGDASTNHTRFSPVTYGDHTYGEVSYGARTGNEYFSSGSQSTSAYSRPSSVRPLHSARFSAVLRNFTPGPKINACASPGPLRTPPKTIGDCYDNTPSVTCTRGNVQEPSIASSRPESPEPDADELTQQSIREDMLTESLESLAVATYPTTPHSTIKMGTQMLLSSLTRSADFVAGSARAGANAVTSILKSATRRNGGVRRVLFRFGTETIDTLDREVREDSVHSDRSHGSYASNGSHGSHASNGSHNSHGYEGSQALRSSGSSPSVGHTPSQGSKGFGQYVEEPDEDHIPSYVKSDKYHEMFMTHRMAFKPQYPVPPGRGLPHYLNKRQHEIKLADMWHVGQMELGKLPRNTAPPTDENHVHFAQQHGWVDPNPNQRADSESDYHEPEYSTPGPPPPVTPRRSPRLKVQTPISVASPSGSVSPASSNNSQRQAARERATNGGDRMDMCRDGAESRFGMRLVSATEASPGAPLFGVVINTPTAYPRTPIVSSSAQLSAPLKAGDLVLRLRPDNTFSTGKLEKLDKYDGPFVISSIAADFATLEFPVHSDANRWVPLKHLKRYVGSITAGSLREATISTIPGLAAIKKVALVREVRTMNGMTQLRVSWHGWPAEDDTWEPAQAVPDEVLEDFTERWEAAEYI